jgi:hypothetical protein
MVGGQFDQTTVKKVPIGRALAKSDIYHREAYQKKDEP